MAIDSGAAAIEQNTALQPKRGASRRDTTPETWRVLIFMDVEQRAQIEAAKAQFAEIREIHDLDPGLSIRLLVHGHQLRPHHDLGSTLYTIDANSYKKETSDEEYVPTNSATLTEFIKEHRANAPTRTVFLYWGHGRGVGRGLATPGIDSSFQSRSSRARDPEETTDRDLRAIVARARRAYGGGDTAVKPLDGIATTSVGPAVFAQNKQESQPLDLVILDSCYMGALETAFEMQGYAEYFVASQSRSQASGLNLSLLLEAAAGTKNGDGGVLGEEVLRQAAQLYSGIKTLVLFDLRRAEVVEAFTKAMKELVTELGAAFQTPNEAQMLVPLCCDTPFFNVRQFLDLKHLCERIAVLTATKSLRQKAEAVAMLLQPGSGGLVASLRGEHNRRAHGPSIYCPWFRASADEIKHGARNVVVDPDAYLRLKLAKGTCWGQLMLALDCIWQAARTQVEVYHRSAGGKGDDEQAFVVARGTDPKNGDQAAVAPAVDEVDTANLYLY